MGAPDGEMQQGRKILYNGESFVPTILSEVTSSPDVVSVAIGLSSAPSPSVQTMVSLDLIQQLLPHLVQALSYTFIRVSLMVI